MKWQHDHIKHIAAQNEKYKHDPLVEKLTDYIARSAYPSPCHFALEMIQNADDEESTEIKFYFEKNSKIIVTNNGNKFSKKDVRTICYAGHSLKKNKKGFFGIGFKSVKRITDTPQIISGNFNFVIHRYYHPEPCNEIPEDITFNPRKGAVFVLPVKSKKQYNNIFKRFMEETNEHLLLFLDYVRRIYIIDSRKKREKNYVLSYDREHGVLENSYSGSKSSWEVFKKLINLPRSIPRPEGKEKVRETEMALAFPVDRKDIPDPQRLFCYLPTRRSTGYPFVIQGDFLPIIGRSDIDEEHPWNKHLLGQLPELIADAFENLRNNPSLRSRILSFLPLVEECHDELFRRYVENVYRQLRSREIVFTRNKNFKKPVDCVALPHELWRLFGNVDLREIFKNSQFAVSEDYSEFERKNLSLLGMQAFGLENIISFFKNFKGIRKKIMDPDWFVSIYAYINDNYRVYEKVALKYVPFLLSETGELVHPEDLGTMKGPRLIANQYMNKETSFFSKLSGKNEMIFLHERFRISRSQKRTKNYDRRLEKVHQLFEFLGVIRTVEAHHIMTQLILPKFQNAQNGERLTHKKAILFANFVLENLSYYRKIHGSLTRTDDWEIFSDIRSKILLLAESRDSTGKKKHVFLSPVQVYTRTQGKKLLPEKHFGSLADVPFVSRKYFSKKILGDFTSIPIAEPTRRRRIYSWNDFFRLMGCWEIPRVIRITRNYSRSDSRLRDDFPNVDWDYHHDSTRGYEISDWVMPELVDTIQKYINATGHGEKDRLKARLVYIRESIAKNWKKYKRYEKAQASYFYRSPYTVEIDSTFHQQLERRWFPKSTDGTLLPPSRIYIDTYDNRYLAPEGYDFIDIPARSREFYKDIGVIEEPDPRDVLERLQKIKTNWDRIDKVPANSFTKMASYYKFLVDKSKTDSELRASIESVFSKDYLIFLPTKIGSKKKIWWHRDQVFAVGTLDSALKPFFQSLFQEDAYGIELEDTFAALGVRNTPGFQEYKRTLQRIAKDWKSASAKKKSELKGKIKYAIEGLSALVENVATDSDGEIRRLLDENIFLTDQNESLRPNQIYLKDDDEIYEVFHDGITTLVYDGEIASISASLIRVGFKSLKGCRKERKPRFVDKESINEDDLEKIREFYGIIEAFIESRFSRSYDSQRENIARSRKLQIYTAKHIKVTYSLDGKRRTRNNVPVFLYKDELVASAVGNNPWSEVIRDEFSKCLSSIFGELASHLKPLINDLHQNPDDINLVIQKWGLEKARVFKKYVEEESQIIKMPLGEKKEEIETSGEESEEEPLVQVVGLTSAPTGTPEPERKDEEVFPLETIKGFVIRNVKTGETTPVVVGRKKRKTKLSKKKKISKMYTPFSSQMIEDMAIEIVKIFEESQGRESIDDVRDDGTEGCDLISSGRGGTRLIEIKAAKGKRPQIILRSSQYKRAKEDKEKYYIYKVENLEKGKIPRIEIVRNPVENPKIRIEHLGECRIEGWEDSDKVSIEVRVKAQ